MPSKLTQSEFIQKATMIHNGVYDYSKVEYRNSVSKVIVVCPEHGAFNQLPMNHLRGTGCPLCGNKRKHPPMRLEEFISKAKIVHKDFFDYSKVEYRGYNSKVRIICPEHGQFEQRANNHLLGIGCPSCGRKSTTEKLIKTEYNFPNSKLSLIDGTAKPSNQRLFLCSCGKKTWQSAYEVSIGKVKTCGGCTRKPQKHWTLQKWGNLVLDSTSSVSTEAWSSFTSKQIPFACSCGTKLYIRMADVSTGHTKSCGCIIPGRSNWSPVRKIEHHLSSLNIEFESENRSHIHPYELDIWISKQNLAIEFNGTYYHSLDGNSPTLDKYRHRNKYQRCEAKGIQLLQIDEHEWENAVTQQIWKSIIASKLGKHQKLSARKTVFRPISSIEANAFLAQHHLQGTTPAIRWAFGLFNTDELVGVITYCWHQKEFINLSRLAFKKNLTVVGGAHKLFKNSLPMLPSGSIISFSHNQYSNGAIYKQLGFSKEKDLPPSYQWYWKGRIWNKRQLRKAALRKMLQDYQANETEHQNLYRHGARCLYDAGYQKWRYLR